MSQSQNVFEAIISTGSTVRRDGDRPDGGFGPWDERLDVAGADLSRLPGAPLLIDHIAQSNFVAGVVEAARVERGAIVAAVRFGSDPRAEQLARDVRDKIRRQLSTAYRVRKWRRDSPEAAPLPVFTATSWTPMEVSLVPIGADAGAVFRSAESAAEAPLRYRSMSTLPPVPAPEVVPVSASPSPLDRTATEEIQRRAMEMERRRISAIDTACRFYRFPDAERQKLISGEVSVDEAQRRILDWAHKQQESTQVTNIHLGDVATERHGRALDGMAAWLGHRLAGGVGEVPAEAREYRGASILDLGRELAQMNGHRGVLTRSGTADVMLGRMGGMHTTSDFALLIGNGSQRALMARFLAAPPALLPVARRTTVSDFREISRMRLGEGSALVKVNEHGEIPRGTVAEAGETYAVETFARIFAFTRQLIVNDDLGALQDFIANMADKASAVLGDKLAALLTTNPVMADGTELFHANHGNIAGSGAAISVTTLSAARAAMRAQRGPNGTLVSVVSRFLIVGPAYETTAEQVLGELAAATASDVNPFAGKLQLLVEPRIPGNTWFVAADPAATPGLEYAELDGSRAMGATGPEIVSRVGFEVEGIEVKCRYDVGVGVVAYQGLYNNPGA